jgi:hypothetical protein
MVVAFIGEINKEKHMETSIRRTYLRGRVHFGLDEVAFAVGRLRMTRFDLDVGALGDELEPLINASEIDDGALEEVSEQLQSLAVKIKQWCKFSNEIASERERILTLATPKTKAA